MTSSEHLHQQSIHVEDDPEPDTIGQSGTGVVPVPQRKRKLRESTLLSTEASELQARQPYTRTNPRKRRKRVNSKYSMDSHSGLAFPARTDPEVYTGERNELWFYQRVLDALEDTPKVCAKSGCTATTNLAIDHIEPFSGTIIGAATRTYCYNGRHYEGVPFTTALRIYNARLNSRSQGDAASERATVGRHFQWMCTPHNSSKGGQQGNDGTGPKPVGNCPGRDDCAATEVTVQPRTARQHSTYE